MSEQNVRDRIEKLRGQTLYTLRDGHPVLVEVVAKGVSFTPQSPGTSGVPRVTRWVQIEQSYAYKAIFAQRPEKVKARIGDTFGPPRPSRHDGSVVRKVYFLHIAALQSQVGQLFSHLSCIYHCQNHRADSVQRRWLLARLR